MGRPRQRGVGWILDEAQRAVLLDRFPPRYDQVIAHHVTLWGHKKGASVPAPATIALVGYAHAGDGIECYVATVDGDTTRPDGNTYHVTWSLDPASGKAPKDSNLLIADHGWTELSEPIALPTRPDYL